MIRRIALTLGAGVAVLASLATHGPSSDAGRLMSLSMDAGTHTTLQVAGKEEPSRSGYIVASS